jgi:LL-diaminopimelate aminotransferase
MGKTPNNISSWDFFDLLLEKAHVVVTPGVGFGSEGEGYIRVSAFGERTIIKKALKSIQQNIRV